MTRTRFSEPLPHGALAEPLPNVFVVTGRFDVGPFGMVSFPRSMVVLRRDAELTIINSVRLSDEGEKDLETLGRVRHLVRLGALHGADDPYYLHRFGPELWEPPNANMSPGGDDIERNLLADGMAPAFAPRGRVYSFQNTRYPEAVLWLPDGRGTLIVCDAIGNFTSTRGFSFVAGLALRMQGAIAPCTAASPAWRRRMRVRNGFSLESDYRRLLTLDFDAVVPAHGDVMIGGAKGALQRSVEQLYGQAKNE